MRTFTKRASSLAFGQRDPDFFAVEATGLRWLAQAGPDGAHVVDVVRVSEDRIDLVYLAQVPATTSAAEDFGRALAVTHSTGASSFGQPPDGWTAGGYIGRQTMSMTPTSHWGTFYAEQRVLPFARQAHRLGHLTDAGWLAVERVGDQLRAGVYDDDRPPARIHGDLWSGNVLFTRRGVVVIDPAAHGGHGLTDLAMLHLFGAPHLGSITEAYVDAADLDPDWASLIGLHQLHPLLVHAVSHGASYGAGAERIAQRYL